MTLREAIVRRCHGVLDWYQGCDLCPETLARINRELGGVITEALADVGRKGAPLPYVLRARAEPDGMLVVYDVPWTTS